jgi:hypothetical protein
MPGPVVPHSFVSTVWAQPCVYSSSKADRIDASAAERLLGSHHVFQKEARSGVGVGADARHCRAASVTPSSGRAPQSHCDLWSWRRPEACSHGSLLRKDEGENLSHTHRGTTVLPHIQQN